jgi:hypothetical protein
MERYEKQIKLGGNSMKRLHSRRRRLSDDWNLVEGDQKYTKL